MHAEKAISLFQTVGLSVAHAHLFGEDGGGHSHLHIAWMSKSALFPEAYDVRLDFLQYEDISYPVYVKSQVDISKSKKSFVSFRLSCNVMV